MYSVCPNWNIFIILDFQFIISSRQKLFSNLFLCVTFSWQFIKSIHLRTTALVYEFWNWIWTIPRFGPTPCLDLWYGLLFECPCILIYMLIHGNSNSWLGLKSTILIARSIKLWIICSWKIRPIFVWQQLYNLSNGWLKQQA